MIQLSLGYPEEEAELDLLERYVKKRKYAVELAGGM